MNRNESLMMINVALAGIDTATQALQNTRKELLIERDKLTEQITAEAKINNEDNQQHPCFDPNVYLTNNLTDMCDIVLDYIDTCQYDNDLRKLGPTITSLKKSPLGWLWGKKVTEFTRASGYTDLEAVDDIMRLHTRIKPLIFSEITNAKWDIAWEYLDMFKETDLQQVIGDPRWSNTNEAERNIARYKLVVEMIRFSSVDKFEGGMMITSNTRKQVETFIYPSRFLKALRKRKDQPEVKVKVEAFRSYLLGRKNKLAQRATQVVQEHIEKRQALLTSHVFEIGSLRHSNHKFIIGSWKNEQKSITPTGEQHIYNGLYLCKFTVKQKGNRSIIYRLVSILKPDVQRNNGVIWAYVIHAGNTTEHVNLYEEEFTYEQFSSTEPKEINAEDETFIELFGDVVDGNRYSEIKEDIKRYHGSLI